MFRIARRALAMVATGGLVALTLLACVQRPAVVIETSTGDVPLETWTGALTSASTGIKGTETLSPGITYRETLAPPSTIHSLRSQPGQRKVRYQVRTLPMS